jgi:hypothetical protein
MEFAVWLSEQESKQAQLAVREQCAGWTGIGGEAQEIREQRDFTPSEGVKSTKSRQ